MPTGPRVLVVGETWITHTVHVKGFSTLPMGGYGDASTYLLAALTSGGCDVRHIPDHLATEQIPWTVEDLQQHDVVVFSDIGADTVLLHPDVERGHRKPNRLKLIGDYVASGGGFLMIGGWVSFSGYGGMAGYHMTALADVLPVSMLGRDDRVETPEGVNPEVRREHEVLRGLPASWPYFLGYNRLMARAGAETLLAVGDDPFLVVGQHGSGRVAAFASDCSPHWASPEFLSWPAYGAFWSQLIRWLAAKRD